jgi:hypothetical protein
VSGGAIAIMCALASIAASDHDRDARRLFRAGERAYEAGQYLGAARALEEAYRLTPLPGIAFSLAQAYRMQYFVDGDPAKLGRAVELYRGYIESTPSGGRRSDAVSLLAEIVPLLEKAQEELPMGPTEAERREPTQLMITTSIEGAVASIDGGPPLPCPALASVEPGAHEISVSAERFFGWNQRVLALEGRLVVIEAELDDKPGRLDLGALEEGIEVWVDGRHEGKTPLPPLELEGGEHRVYLARSGRLPVQRLVSLESDGSATVEGPRESTSQRRFSHYTFGAAGLVLAAAGVMTGLTIATDGQASSLLEKRDSTGLTVTEAELYGELQLRRGDRARVATALGATGLAFAAVGALLYLFDPPAPPP